MTLSNSRPFKLCVDFELDDTDDDKTPEYPLSDDHPLSQHNRARLLEKYAANSKSLLRPPPVSPKRLTNGLSSQVAPLDTLDDLADKKNLTNKTYSIKGDRWPFKGSTRMNICDSVPEALDLASDSMSRDSDAKQNISLTAKSLVEYSVKRTMDIGLKSVNDNFVSKRDNTDHILSTDTNNNMPNVLRISTDPNKAMGDSKSPSQTAWQKNEIQQKVKEQSTSQPKPPSLKYFKACELTLEIDDKNVPPKLSPVTNLCPKLDAKANSLSPTFPPTLVPIKMEREDPSENKTTDCQDLSPDRTSDEANSVLKQVTSRSISSEQEKRGSPDKPLLKNENTQSESYAMPGGRKRKGDDEECKIEKTQPSTFLDENESNKRDKSVKSKLPKSSMQSGPCLDAMDTKEKSSKDNNLQKRSKPKKIRSRKCTPVSKGKKDKPSGSRMSLDSNAQSVSTCKSYLCYPYSNQVTTGDIESTQARQHSGMQVTKDVIESVSANIFTTVNQKKAITTKINTQENDSNIPSLASGKQPHPFHHAASSIPSSLSSQHPQFLPSNTLPAICCASYSNLTHQTAPLITASIPRVCTTVANTLRSVDYERSAKELTPVDFRNIFNECAVSLHNRPLHQEMPMSKTDTSVNQIAINKPYIPLNSEHISMTAEIPCSTPLLVSQHTRPACHDVLKSYNTHSGHNSIRMQTPLSIQEQRVGQNQMADVQNTIYTSNESSPIDRLALRKEMPTKSNFKNDSSLKISQTQESHVNKSLSRKYCQQAPILPTRSQSQSEPLDLSRKELSSPVNSPRPSLKTPISNNETHRHPGTALPVTEKEISVTPRTSTSFDKKSDISSNAIPVYPVRRPEGNLTRMSFQGQILPGINYPQQHPTQQYPTQRNPTQNHPGQHPSQHNPTQNHAGQHPSQHNPTQNHPGQHPTQNHPGQHPTKNYPGQHPTQNHPGQYPTQNHPGQHYPTQNYPGQHYLTQNHPGQRYPTQNHPGQHFPTQNHPGQPYLIQNHPGQPYSPQNHQRQNPIHHSTHKNLTQNHATQNYPPLSHPSHGHPPQNHPPQNHPPQNHPPLNYSTQNHATQNHPTQNHPPQNHSTQNHATQNHPTQNHPPQNHSTQNHATQNHATQNHPPLNHPTQNHPPHNHPPQNHPTQNPPPQNHPPQNHPPQNHPTQNNPTQNHPAQNHPTQNHSTQNHPTQNNPAQHPTQHQLHDLSLTDVSVRMADTEKKSESLGSHCERSRGNALPMKNKVPLNPGEESYSQLALAAMRSKRRKSLEMCNMPQENESFLDFLQRNGNISARKEKILRENYNRVGGLENGELIDLTRDVDDVMSISSDDFDESIDTPLDLHDENHQSIIDEDQNQTNETSKKNEGDRNESPSSVQSASDQRRKRNSLIGESKLKILPEDIEFSKPKANTYRNHFEQSSRNMAEESHMFSSLMSVPQGSQSILDLSKLSRIKERSLTLSSPQKALMAQRIQEIISKNSKLLPDYIQPFNPSMDACVQNLTKLSGRQISQVSKLEKEVAALTNANTYRKRAGSRSPNTLHHLSLPSKIKRSYSHGTDSSSSLCSPHIDTPPLTMSENRVPDSNKEREAVFSDPSAHLSENGETGEEPLSPYKTVWQTRFFTDNLSHSDDKETTSSKNEDDIFHRLELMHNAASRIHNEQTSTGNTAPTKRRRRRSVKRTTQAAKANPNVNLDQPPFHPLNHPGMVRLPAPTPAQINPFLPPALMVAPYSMYPLCYPASRRPPPSNQPVLFGPHGAPINGTDHRNSLLEDFKLSRITNICPNESTVESTPICSRNVDSGFESPSLKHCHEVPSQPPNVLDGERNNSNRHGMPQDNVQHGDNDSNSINNVPTTQDSTALPSSHLKNPLEDIQGLLGCGSDSGTYLLQTRNEDGLTVLSMQCAEETESTDAGAKHGENATFHQSCSVDLDLLNSFSDEIGISSDSPPPKSSQPGIAAQNLATLALASENLERISDSRRRLTMKTDASSVSTGSMLFRNTAIVSPRTDIPPVDISGVSEDVWPKNQTPNADCVSNRVEYLNTKSKTPTQGISEKERLVTEMLAAMMQNRNLNSRDNSV